MYVSEQESRINEIEATKERKRAKKNKEREKKREKSREIAREIERDELCLHRAWHYDRLGLRPTW